VQTNRGVFRSFLVLVPVLCIGLSACENGEGCQTHASTACKDGVTSWVDSCGEMEEEYEICQCGCDAEATACEPGSGCCALATCGSLGKECGSWPDGCEGTLECGGCGMDQNCDSQGQCQSICLSDEDCLFGWYCVDSACRSGSIAELCDDDQDCDHDLVCVVSQRTCRAGLSGDPCDDEADCSPEGICHDGACSPATPGPCSSLVLLEAIWAPAAGGGTWVSELMITDPVGGAEVSARFFESGGNIHGPFPLWTSAGSGNPGLNRSATFSNILQTLETLDTGVSYQGKVGSLWLTTQDPSHPILATIRMANGEYSKVVQGMCIDDVHTADVSRPQMIQNLTSDSTYRSSVGCFNPTHESVTTEFSLLGADGNIIGTPFERTFVDGDFQAFPPFSEAGIPYPATSYDNTWLSVRPTSGSGKLMCYGATTNNTTSDPSYHAALHASPGFSNSPRHELILPEAIWAPASGGGTWSSEVQITDTTGGSLLKVSFYLGLGVRRGPFTLWQSPGLGASFKVSNILEHLQTVLDPGFSYDGKVGALVLETQDEAHRIHAAVRIRNGDVSKVMQGFGVTNARTVDVRRRKMIQNMKSTDAFRTSVTCFNPTSESVYVEFRLMDGDGRLIGLPIFRYFVGRDFQAFMPFAEAFIESVPPYPEASYENTWLQVNPTSGAGRVVCSGALANNVSNDPASQMMVALPVGEELGLTIETIVWLPEEYDWGTGVAVGELTNDPGDELVIGAVLDYQNGAGPFTGKVFAYNLSVDRNPRWEHSSSQEDYVCGLDIGDVDGDGANEVAVGYISVVDAPPPVPGQMELLNADGTLRWASGLPYSRVMARQARIGELVAGSPGKEVIFVGGSSTGPKTGYLVLCDQAGQSCQTHDIVACPCDPPEDDCDNLPSWHFKLQAARIADLDLDGLNEIVVTGGWGTCGNVHALNGDSTKRWTTRVGNDSLDLAVADFDASRLGLEIAVPSARRHSWNTTWNDPDTENRLTLLDSSGAVLWQNNLAIDAYATVAGDIDGDGTFEILVGYGNYMPSLSPGNAGGGVAAFDATGKLIGDVKLPATPMFMAFGDVDHDGSGEVVASCVDRRVFVIGSR